MWLFLSFFWKDALYVVVKKLFLVENESSTLTNKQTITSNWKEKIIFASNSIMRPINNKREFVYKNTHISVDILLFDVSVRISIQQDVK